MVCATCLHTVEETPISSCLLKIWIRKNSSMTVKFDLDLDSQRISFLDNVQPQELQMWITSCHGRCLAVIASTEYKQSFGCRSQINFSAELGCTNTHAV